MGALRQKRGAPLFLGIVAAPPFRPSYRAVRVARIAVSEGQMSVLARVFAGVILALSLALPAAAVQPKGSAGWTTDGWTNFSGTLYHGPGVQYPVSGHVD